MRLIDSQMTDNLKKEMRLEAKKIKMHKSLLEAAKRIAKNSMYGGANYIVTNSDFADFINKLQQDTKEPNDENQ